jgi:hypothetical protein
MKTFESPIERRMTIESDLRKEKMWLPVYNQRFKIYLGFDHLITTKECANLIDTESMWKTHATQTRAYL